MKFLALATILLLAFLCFPSMAQLPPGVPEPVPVVGWGFLQEEAINVLEAKGFPRELTPVYARSEIRAYVFARLIDIINKAPYARTTEEEAAYNQFQSVMRANRYANASNAVKYWDSISDGDPCWSSSFPNDGRDRIYVPPNVLVSIFCTFFQDEKPNQREVYRGQGAAENYRKLLTGNGQAELVEVINATDWLGAGSIYASGPLFQSDTLAEQDYQGAMQVVRDIRSKNKNDFLLALVNPAVSPELVIQAVLQLGTAAWEFVDFLVIGNDLRAERDAALSTDLDLVSIADSQLLELTLVFMGAVLSATDTPATGTCDFKDSYNCQLWNVREQDPDFMAERYNLVSMPLSDTDSYFALRKQGDLQWQVSQDLSPFDLEGVGSRLWALPVPDDIRLNGEIGGSSTRLQQPLPEGVETPNDLRIADGSGISTIISDGFFIHTPVDPNAGLDTDNWKYATQLKYRDWQGEWWKALPVNGSFLHLRDSGTAVTGSAQVAGFLQYDGGEVFQGGGSSGGYKYCKGWTRWAGGFNSARPSRDIGTVDGHCILVSKDFDHDKVAVGDRIEIGGQIRTVKDKVNCEGVDLDNNGGIVDLFIDQLWCDEGDNSTHVLDPATTNWHRTALVVDEPVASLVPDGEFDYGPSRRYVIRKLDETDACAQSTIGLDIWSCGYKYKPENLDLCPRFGRQFNIDTSVLADPPAEEVFDDDLWSNEYSGLDCFYSPMVRYQSSDLQNWAALFLPPAQAVSDGYGVSEQTLTVLRSDGVIRNDQIPSSASITDKSTYLATLVSSPVHGTLDFNPDGSFVYTRGLSDDDTYGCEVGSPYCGPDSFDYEVCHLRNGRSDCATATVELSVRNGAPRIFDLNFAPEGSDYRASYTYYDPEDDPELGSLFTWHVSGGGVPPRTIQTNTSLLPGDGSFDTVEKVVISAMASRGSWPSGSGDYSSDENGALRYGVEVQCTPEHLLPGVDEVDCEFKTTTDRPYTLPVPFQLHLGHIGSLAFQWTPETCDFPDSIGWAETDEHICAVKMERRPGFTDSGSVIHSTFSVWINGGRPDGDRVLTSARYFQRSPDIHPVTASVNIPAGGTAVCSPSQVPQLGSSTCTATPNAGWQFAGWTQDCLGVDLQCTLARITGSRSVLASFLPLIETIISPLGGGTASCNPNPVPINSGYPGSCIATPNPGYSFVGWSGDCTGPESECELAIVPEPMTVTANFQLLTILGTTPTNSGVPRVEVGAANGWTMTASDDPLRPTLGWIPWTGSPDSPGVLPPPNLEQLYALLDFVLESGTPGSTAEIVITYPDPLPSGVEYWMYDRDQQIWAPLDPSGYSVNGNIITLRKTDGGIGDDDGIVNGIIVDPGGPVVIVIDDIFYSGFEGVVD